MTQPGAPFAGDIFCGGCGRQTFALREGASYLRRCRSCGHEAAYKAMDEMDARLMERAAAGVVSWR